MNSQNNECIRSFVQNWLVKARLDLKCSVESAAHLLELNEAVLSDYEAGKKTPAGYEMFRILKKYQADLDQFALELALLQVNINLNRK